MSVLTLVENWEGDFKKTSFESVAYSKQIADQLQTKLFVITFGGQNIENLKNYGADKIFNIQNVNLETASNKTIAKSSIELIEENDINTIIISNTNMGKSISPLLAHMLNAELIANAIDYPKNHCHHIQCP